MSRDISEVITNILGFEGNTSLAGLMGSKLGQFQDRKGFAQMCLAPTLSIYPWHRLEYILQSHGMMSYFTFSH